MNYICLHCGHHFDTPKSGYEGGYPEEPTDECPNCGSLDIEEAQQCPICGEYFSEEDMRYGVCADCVKKAVTPDNAIAYGKARQIGVEINGFLGWVYPADEIEKILLQHFISESDTWQSRMVNEYCNDDVYDFGEWLTEEINDESKRRID